MDIASGIIIFIVVAIICVVIRVLCIITCRNFKAESPPRTERRVIRRIRIDPPTLTTPARVTETAVGDRQGNNFATAEEAARDNRFNDIFFIEPNSPEAARIRAQLEKDDKDLPSYDEVMRMTNLSTPTAAPAAGAVNFVPAMPSALSMGASSSSVNTTDTTLTVPPYTSADPNVSSSSRPLTPPPYTPEPIGASVVLPITTPLHSQQPAQSS
ncbi:uncharacterized protein LOC119608731 isoform X1 [Lucilia sericata]|uniref:uncharacterized protein LOC119608731 isoform X1 n=1 Tax=Lucilia sericata TaxID=13632 RepID=UPI0018A80DE4|nr:uncharacterized protein LOC119608731 isoform X1 [Lucilia sericata]